MSCAKTDEPIKMPFERQTRVGQGTVVSDGDPACRSPTGTNNFMGCFSWNQIRMITKVDAANTNVGVRRRCVRLSNYSGHLLCLVRCRVRADHERLPATGGRYTRLRNKNSLDRRYTRRTGVWQASIVPGPAAAETGAPAGETGEVRRVTAGTELREMAPPLPAADTEAARG